MTAHIVSVSFEEDFALMERRGEVIKLTQEYSGVLLETIKEEIRKKLNCPVDQIFLHNDVFEFLPMEDSVWEEFKHLMKDNK